MLLRPKLYQPRMENTKAVSVHDQVGSLFGACRETAHSSGGTGKNAHLVTTEQKKRRGEAQAPPFPSRP